MFLLDCAGTVELDAPRRVIEIRRTTRVTAGEAWAELRPLGPAARAAEPVLEMDLSIDFVASAIGRQSASLRLSPDSFRRGIAAARTFANADEVAQLQAAGLALGGSLQNAIVVDGAAILNPGGLRMDNEFAGHKMVVAVGRSPNGKKIAADKAGVIVTDRGFINVDSQMRTNVPHIFAIGDLALAGGTLHGRYVANRPGHGLNNRLMRALFADASRWRMVATDPLTVAA